MTVLSLASPIARENFIYKNVKQWFDAGVAFYPSCGKQELIMPVVVFIGELDEWTSATNCKMWKKRDEEQISSGMLQIFIYKNAHHAFNRELIKNYIGHQKTIMICQAEQYNIIKSRQTFSNKNDKIFC